MLTDLPLERLLEGAAESLREEVAPHVEDPFGRMQLRAIDELLRNLAARATWNPDEVAADASAAAKLADRVEELGWSPGAARDRMDAVEGSVDRALAERRVQLLRLREAIRWAQGAGPEGERARAEIEERLTSAGKRERELLIAGMYG